MLLELTEIETKQAGSQAGLNFLREDLAGELDALTLQLQDGSLTAAEWSDEFEVLLARYHTAGLLLGQGNDQLTVTRAEWLARFVGEQFDYLANFEVDIQDSEEWAAGFNARAASYADAMKVPFWSGDTEFLPLPAMPAEGTQCMNNCGCSWVIDPIDEEAGDFDCYWERSLDDSCQTCLQREADWSPIEIRGWELQL